eukprot:scaffold42145_cov48-Phaeocystis_antarctica.AAC.3
MPPRAREVRTWPTYCNVPPPSRARGSCGTPPPRAPSARSARGAAPPPSPGASSPRPDPCASSRAC